MESEDEVDIEGECDLSESPTKYPESQSEVLQHPWVLEQGWSPDVCTDEKSKALIDTMLWEEQQYLSSLRKVGSHQSVNSKHDNSTESTMMLQPKTPKKQWTGEQKQLFIQGLEIFGRKWKKIAEIIPGKTDEQVKHYAGKYFKQLKENQIMEEKGTTTLKTLVKPNNTSRKKGKKTCVKLEDKKIQDKRNTSLEMFPDAQIVRITKDTDSDSEEVDIDLDIETESNDKIECENSDTNHKQFFLSSERSQIWGSNCTITTDSLSQIESSSYSTKSHLDRTEPCLGVINLLDVNEKETESDNKGINIQCFLEQNDQFNVLIHKNECDTLESKTVCTDSSLYQSQYYAPSSQEAKIIQSDNVHMDQPFNAVDEQVEHSEDIYNRLDTNKPCSKFLENLETIKSCSKTLEKLYTNKSCCKTPEKMDTNKLFSNTLEKHGENIPGNLNQVIESESMNNIVPFQSNTKEEEQESQNTEESTEDEHMKEFPVQGSDGKIFYLQNPTEEQTLVPNKITAQEKDVFVEFFDGRPGLKYADKYVEIRNSILDLWEKCKPNYLAKTVMRNGLKKWRCDVNLLGRIHTYLEQIGAINFGCEQVQYKNKKKRKKKVYNAQESHLDGKYNKEALSKRRRKVRDMFGMWVDPKFIEGRTIDHDKNEVCTEIVKPKKKRTNVATYDPFKLIPCQDFGVSVPAPFDVVLDIKVLILMDIHAHMSKTEVIGLLGGTFNGKDRVLKVLVAEPCESLSTGMQCEMDPVSQTEASEKISDHGYKVVGWYHSHPTFEPNPSVRDIETQENFQTWFSIGKNPFIGMIVSPYCLNNYSILSLVRCLIISKSTNKCANIGLPFQFKYTVTHNGECFDDVIQKVESLLEKNIHSKNKVEMLYTFKQSFTITCLEKLCKSLKQYFMAAGSSKDKDVFLEKLTQLITERCSPEKTNITDTEHF